ncbi:MAG: septum formation initiator family protein [Gammaproteobacteria bacterium]|nr:septum formation initiator family protein [Gammaproteobacteria bacterium]MDP2140970.1 septum formation initiator family protein [Gammaproteobacteria bacterium]MDP2349286.1 septum formation initiator family protein [Gammaproteobacteria bacterium]
MKVLLATLVAILLVLQFNLWTGEGSFAQLRDLEAQLEMQREENVILAARNQELESEVLDLKTGLDAVEERARSEFGMVKKDETLYLIVE